MQEEWELAEEDLAEAERQLVLIDEAGEAMAEQRTLEKLIAQLQKDKQILETVVSAAGTLTALGSNGMAIAQQLSLEAAKNAPLVGGVLASAKLIAELTVNSIKAAERWRLWYKFRNEAGKALLRGSCAAARDPKFLRQQEGTDRPAHDRRRHAGDPACRGDLQDRARTRDDGGRHPGRRGRHARRGHQHLRLGRLRRGRPPQRLERDAGRPRRPERPQGGPRRLASQSDARHPRRRLGGRRTQAPRSHRPLGLRRARHQRTDARRRRDRQQVPQIPDRFARRGPPAHRLGKGGPELAALEASNSPAPASSR